MIYLGCHCLLSGLCNMLTFAAFATCWDNVGIESKARHQSRDKTNVIHLYTNAYAVKDRVTSTRPMTSTPEKLVRASDLPLTAFMPSPEDYNSLRQRMEVIVERILVAHVPWLRDYTSYTCTHILHTHSEESALKSDTVSCCNACPLAY